MTLQTPESLTTPALAEAIRLHNRLYFVDHAPQLSDAAFDALVAELRRRSPEHPVLQEVGAPVESAAESDKVVHLRPMLSLEKCNTAEEFHGWLRGLCAGLLNRPNNPKSLPDADVHAWGLTADEAWLVVTPKIDGLACSIHYDAEGALRLAATRGDGQIGENVTHSVRRVGNVPERVPPDLGGLEVRGEVYLPLSTFQGVAGDYANPRNLAAGILKAKDNPALPPEELRFFAYDVVGRDFSSEMAKLAFAADMGLTPAPHERVRPALAETVFARWVQERPAQDYEADGVVLKLDDTAQGARLGLTAHHPRNAVAWKFGAESGLTVLREVEWSVARTGTITPVAIVEPVQLSGAAVTRATLHNVSNLRRLGLRIGDRVELVRRGGVIPHVESTHGGGDQLIEPPAVCPGCGNPTRLETTLNKATGKTTELLLCTMPAGCMATRQRQLLHFCAALELDGFGEKIVDVLLTTGLVMDAADLYTLGQGDVEELPRMGALSAQKLLAEVNRARRVELPLFLRALGIDSLGKHAAALLANRWTLPEIRALTVDEMAGLHSLGEVTATQIVAGLVANAGLIDRLLEHVELYTAQSSATDGPLAGQVVVFTGTLTRMKRSDAQARVVKLGGLAGDSVTAETTMLCVGADEIDSATPSSKLKKARKLLESGGKIQILVEDAFWRLVEAP